MTTVLVVDDEPQIVRALRINLSARGYEVLTAHDGGTALEIAARERPDVVVLDLGLPDIDGVDVIAGLRGWTSMPIVVLIQRLAKVSKRLPGWTPPKGSSPQVRASTHWNSWWSFRPRHPARNRVDETFGPCR